MKRRLFVTGDTHRIFNRIYDFFSDYEENKNIDLIILGDAGIGYENNKSDRDIAKKLAATNLTFYCLRGNHELRPEDMNNVDLVLGTDGAPIWQDLKYPNIKYFIDGAVYHFGKKSFLTIGGAYSVDKYYRLMMNRKWFPNEQLTPEEMIAIETNWGGQHFNYVLTHTCPYSWQPTDLFLKSIDQNTVDNTMEIWLDGFKDTISFDNWLFGHYHADRIIMNKPYIKMFYYNIEEIKL